MPGKPSAESRKSKDTLDILEKEQLNATSSLNREGKNERAFEDARDSDSARVMEWMKDCEEPALLNLLDDVVKIEGLLIPSILF